MFYNIFKNRGGYMKEPIVKKISTVLFISLATCFILIFISIPCFMDKSDFETLIQKLENSSLGNVGD